MKTAKMVMSAFLISTIIMSGCTHNLPQETQLNSELVEQTQESLSESNTDNSIGKRYFVTIQIKQSHFSLDIDEHIKDSLNKCSFEIPVDKEFYDSVSIGHVLEDSFRTGSAVVKGSFGKWKVTIIDKEIK